MFNRKYLSSQVLKGFEQYKYNAVDTSPISHYISHPFWNKVVLLCPRWVAPNVLTLSGFICLLLQFLVLSYYDFHYYASGNRGVHQPVPKWVWYFSSLMIFLAHTLDGIDGKQARRIGFSGPLGELFDHGIDSWATTFIPIGVYSVFGRGPLSASVHQTLFILMGVMLAFGISHWEKYNTGILYLPWGYDSSQIGITALYLIAGVYNVDFLLIYFPALNCTTGQLAFYFLTVIILLMSLPVSFYNIYKSYENKTGKLLSPYESFRPLIPMLLEFSALAVWVHFSSSNILEKQPRIFYLMTGTVFSNIACRLIVNGMSITRCQAFNFLLAPLFVIDILVVCRLSVAFEFYFLFLYTAVAVLAHLHYAICVVHQLSNHLGICVFVPKKKILSTSK